MLGDTRVYLSTSDKAIIIVSLLVYSLLYGLSYLLRINNVIYTDTVDMMFLIVFYCLCAFLVLKFSKKPFDIMRIVYFGWALVGVLLISWFAPVGFEQIFPDMDLFDMHISRYRVGRFVHSLFLLMAAGQYVLLAVLTKSHPLDDTFLRLLIHAGLVALAVLFIGFLFRYTELQVIAQSDPILVIGVCAAVTQILIASVYYKILLLFIEGEK